MLEECPALSDVSKNQHQRLRNGRRMKRPVRVREVRSTAFEA